MNDSEKEVLQKIVDECQLLLDYGHEGLPVTLMLNRWGLGIAEIKLKIWELLNAS